MKTNCSSTSFFVILLLIICGGFSGLAQESTDYYTISGVVKDQKTKKKVEYVNVSAIGTNVGTVTNEDGEFSLKLDNSLRVNEIQLSCVGYYNTRISINKGDRLNQTFYIKSQAFQLSEVEVFSWQNPRDLVRAAAEKIAENYSKTPNLLTGFYRETVQKRRKFITISEAVLHVYKTGYESDVKNDRIQILKGRRLISPKAADTLSVKLLGGPNLAVFLDIVKNPDLLLSDEALQYYSYKMGEATLINDKLQYVVHFQPQVLLPIPLYSGVYYIDRETLAFTRAEFSIDMKDKLKVTDMILKYKPKGLRFSPEEVSYIITYKQQNGKTYLNYVHNEIQFKCDWSRRLFATGYTVINESVITDNQEDNVEKISMKNAFSVNHSLSEEVSAYMDEDFWGAYNIIEPTESLENAVNKLRKQQRPTQ
jgi:hypothetical protein